MVDLNFGIGTPESLCRSGRRRPLLATLPFDRSRACVEHHLLDHARYGCRSNATSMRPYSAATRRSRAYVISASSATGTIGVKSRCAIHSGLLNLVMWFETAHKVRYTILRG